MTSGPHSLEPDVIIVENDPGCAAHVRDIVLTALSVEPAIYSDTVSAFESCLEHPAYIDLIITREGDGDFSGFKLLKQLDAIFLRPVFAILLLNPGQNEASAETWFAQLDKAFETIIPFKTIRFPYRLSELGTALNKAFPWRQPEVRFCRITEDHTNP